MVREKTLKIANYGIITKILYFSCKLLYEVGSGNGNEGLIRPDKGNGMGGRKGYSVNN